MEKDKGEGKRSLSKKFWRLFWYILLLTGWAFCSIIVSQLIIGIIIGLFLGAETINTPVVSALYSAFSYGIALFLIIFVPPRMAESWGKKMSVSREQLGLSGLPTWVDIGLSPVAFIVSTLLAVLLVQLFTLLPWFNAVEAQSTGFNFYMNSGERVIAFLVLVVIAPIFEEIIFRGWLYGKLRARMGAPIAIVIVSVLFGIMHFQWNVGINVFALSVVLCVLREITGTIYAGILTHMIKNGVAFYLLYMVGIGM